MNSITSIMLNEHQHILKATELIEKNIMELEDGEELNTQFYQKMLIFLREYADKIHHAKEEDILFQKVQQLGLIEQDEEIKRLLHQHILSRGLFEEIEKALLHENKKKIIRLFKEYIPMIREHIKEEDNELFPLLELKIDSAAKQEIVDEFDEYDSKNPATGYLAVLEQVENA